MIDIFGIAVAVKKSHRGKGFRIIVRQDGSVVFSLPRWVPLSVGKRFLRSKSDWILKARKQMQVRPQRLLMQGDAKEYRMHKEAARRLVATRVEKFLLLYGVSSRSLSIRNQRTRFGSCSARGHLSFNYRLLFLPEPLLDYVVAHEVSHLLELNHSRRFWALVAQTIPEYQERKRELQAFSRTV